MMSVVSIAGSECFGQQTQEGTSPTTNNTFPVLFAEVNSIVIKSVSYCMMQAAFIILGWTYAHYAVSDNDSIGVTPKENILIAACIVLATSFPYYFVYAALQRTNLLKNSIFQLNRNALLQLTLLIQIAVWILYYCTIRAYTAPVNKILVLLVCAGFCLSYAIIFIVCLVKGRKSVQKNPQPQSYPDFGLDAVVTVLTIFVILGGTIFGIRKNILEGSIEFYHVDWFVENCAYEVISAIAFSLIFTMATVFTIYCDIDCATGISLYRLKIVVPVLLTALFPAIISYANYIIENDIEYDFPIFRLICVIAGFCLLLCLPKLIRKFLSLLNLQSRGGSSSIPRRLEYVFLGIITLIALTIAFSGLEFEFHSKQPSPAGNSFAFFCTVTIIAAAIKYWGSICFAIRQHCQNNGQETPVLPKDLLGALIKYNTTLVVGIIVFVSILPVYIEMDEKTICMVIFAYIVQLCFTKEIIEKYKNFRDESAYGKTRNREVFLASIHIGSIVLLLLSKSLLKWLRRPFNLFSDVAECTKDLDQRILCVVSVLIIILGIPMIIMKLLSQINKQTVSPTMENAQQNDSSPPLLAILSNYIAAIKTVKHIIQAIQPYKLKVYVLFHTFWWSIPLVICFARSLITGYWMISFVATAIVVLDILLLYKPILVSFNKTVTTECNGGSPSNSGGDSI